MQCFILFYEMALDYGGSSSHALAIFKMKTYKDNGFDPIIESCTPLFEIYELLTMICVHLFQMLKLLKRIFQSFRANQFVHHDHTQFRNNFQYLRHYHSLFEKNITLHRLKLYNNLPATLK